MKSLILCALILACSAYGQQQRIKVYLQAKGDDAVGSRLIYYTREALNRSSRYGLVESKEQASYVASLITIDGGYEPGRTGLSTVGSLVVYSNAGNCAFVQGHTVFAVGSRQAESAGDNVIADIDHFISSQ